MRDTVNNRMNCQTRGIVRKGFPQETDPIDLQCLYGALRCYPWQVTRVEWVQDGVYRVLASEGVFCLKQSGRPPEKTLFSLQAMLFLRNNGFWQQPQVVMTKNHGIMATVLDVTGQPTHWFAITWLPGNKSVFAVPGHLQACTLALAAFHSRAVGFRAKGSVLQYHMWPEILTERQQQMKRFMQLVAAEKESSGKEQEQLQRIFTQYYPWALQRGRRALSLLQGSGYVDLADAEQEQGKFIHGDVAARNFIVAGRPGQNNLQGFLIDFDYARYDLQMIDLARYIERCLRMSNFHLPYFYQIIHIYQRWNPMNKQQRQVLAAQLLYPQKFWRLSQRWLTNKDETNVSLRRFGYLEKSSQGEAAFLQIVEKELLC